MSAMTKELLEKIKDKNVIVFDGECVLCSGFFNFVLKHDHGHKFHFLTAQSELGETLYTHYELKHTDYDTNLVILEGELFERLHGFFEVIKLLDWPWRALNIFSVLPDRILDWGYYRIARNRFHLFGRREYCFVPDAKLRARFVE